MEASNKKRFPPWKLFVFGLGLSVVSSQIVTNWKVSSNLDADYGWLVIFVRFFLGALDLIGLAMVIAAVILWIAKGFRKLAHRGE